MKKIKILVICICLIILTGCSCSRKNESTKGVEKTLISSIHIATGDIGFQSINIDSDGNENDVITLDSTSNILLTTYPDVTSEEYEFIYSDKGIIEIDENFNIKPLKVGKTTITAKSTDGSDVESNKVTIEVIDNVDSE